MTIIKQLTSTSPIKYYKVKQVALSMKELITQNQKILMYIGRNLLMSREKNKGSITTLDNQAISDK